VIENKPNNVVITSWDDWAEETAIDNTTEWNSMYYNITKRMIKRYKEE
jgi:hypothetical protein